MYAMSRTNCTMITRPIINLATVSWRSTALASEVVSSSSTLGKDVVGIVPIVHLFSAAVGLGDGVNERQPCGGSVGRLYGVGTKVGPGPIGPCAHTRPVNRIARHARASAFISQSQNRNTKNTRQSRS